MRYKFILIKNMISKVGYNVNEEMATKMSDALKDIVGFRVKV